ncbi:MAG: SurA N-terminal domain-containing protein, partial [Paracoccaceae bacterium]|nr:SurA N-terminal domain-containing protein [Paracoccaceae bacterium]
MRSKTSKTFAWIIVFILVIGLAGFGIQDVLRSSGKNEVASFGNQKISSDDYVRMIQQEIRNLSQQFGTNLTFEQAQSLGVAQTALQKLISSAVLDQTLEDLGISQSDSTLENSIKNNAAFLDIAGRFSAEKYRDVLLNVNLQPNEYEKILRKELSREL